MSVTTSRTFEMTRNEYIEEREADGGRCLACGAEANGIEPDARNYSCETCGESEVFGLEELLLMGLLTITAH